VAQGSRLKPLLQNAFCRRSFSPEPAFKIPKATDEGPSPTIPNLPPSMTQGSRLKPLLPKHIVLFGRRGFRPEPLPSRSQRPRMKAAPCSPEPCAFGGARVAAKAAPTKTTSSFVGRRGFRPEPAFKIPKATDEAAPHNPEPPIFDDVRVAAKAAPTKTTPFFLVGGAFAPNSCLQDPKGHG
jgi:hypothetical protein